MTDEEQELFNNIIREAYGKIDPEKIKQEALWRESLLKKEITVEQYSEKVDSLYNVSFFECL